MEVLMNYVYLNEKWPTYAQQKCEKHNKIEELMQHSTCNYTPIETVAQSRQNLRCSLIQVVSREEPSDRKPDPWPLWMAGHAQLKLVMTECSKTQIRLTGLILCLAERPFRKMPTCIHYRNFSVLNR